jgi:hypothetical protein
MSASGRVSRVRPGDEINAYCGKCKQERTHQVVALNSDGRADRVICRFCESNHLYREIKTGAERASNAKKYRTTQEPASSARPGGATLLQPYSGKAVYAEGDMIQHPKFGQGRVVEVRNGKIDVRFGSEIRILLHGG